MPATDFVLTPAESKRLIARAVHKMEPVARALQDGTVLICTGSTNAFVAEEILGRKFPHYQYLTGNTTPSVSGAKDLFPAARRPDVVLRKGKIDPDLDRFSVLEHMQPDDVYIKGANAINYAQGMAGILIGGFGGAGTIGSGWGHIVGRRLRLVIPAGLEKCIADDIFAVADRLNQHDEYDPDAPRMMPVFGEIVTEIEALRILTGAEAYHIASGGIAGAEGAVRLLVEGSRGEFEAAKKLLEDIAGEPPFLDNVSGEIDGEDSWS